MIALRSAAPMLVYSTLSGLLEDGSF